MNLVLNILWIILGGGFAIFCEYLVAGLLMCLTVIGIPFGVQAMKISVLGLLPFGKEVADTESSGDALPLVLNILWIVLGGIWIAITHVILAVYCAITIIGIPFAIQHMKLAKLSLMPFGKTIRELD